jgi:hypothetical protein
MKALYLFFILLLVHSCLNKNSSPNKEGSYLSSFELIKDPSPNPDKAVFRIHSDIKLREVLLSEKWDSIRFSGGLFDTISYNQELIGIAETDVPHELIMGMHTLSFLIFTQSQMDSIALKAFDKIEVTIYYKTDTWKLKPHVKNEGKL